MIFLGTGSVLAYAMDAAFQNVAHGWRCKSPISTLHAINTDQRQIWSALVEFHPSYLVSSCSGVPESPRQLIFHNKRDQAERVIRKIYPNASEQQVASKLLSIEQGVTQSKALEEEVTVRKALKNLFCVPANARAAIAACGLMFFQVRESIPRLANVFTD